VEVTVAEVTEIRPEGIKVIIKFDLEELAKLKHGLDNAIISADMTDPDNMASRDYITKELYPLIKNVLEDLHHGT
jgi:hypothetical protein